MLVKNMLKAAEAKTAHSSSLHQTENISISMGPMVVHDEADSQSWLLELGAQRVDIGNDDLVDVT
jgi:hypothetical protein